MRVLIVDDEENSVEPLMNELRKRSFVPRICNFENVETQLKEFRPGVVVLDLLKGRPRRRRRRDISTDLGDSFLPDRHLLGEAGPDRERQ